MAEGTVLLVEADPEEQKRLGVLLEGAGFGVSICPGPTGPDYRCIGDREGICPLLEPADVVVLDLALRSEDVVNGTAAETLLALYVSAGKPVVALGSWRGLDPYAEAGVFRLPRQADGPAVLAAVAASYEGKG